ncbi:DUF7507 domain-containing protein, partial [Loktanella sp. D2R18]|uniref:DUF7507 domain-containing protein n=2 Tax=Rhodobacterales TaxID=204455 RepID=UPI003F8D2CE6
MERNIFWTGSRVAVGLIVWAMGASGAQAQAVDATANSGTTGSQIALIVPQLNNTVNDVIVSGFPSDAVLSAGVQDITDDTVWFISASDITAGVTFTTSTSGSYDLTFAQATSGNQFTAFDNGTFGSGASEFSAASLGSGTSFTFVDGTGATQITPGEYAIVQSTDAVERANVANEASCDGIYLSLDDQDNPGSGYFAMYDAQSATTDPNQTFITATITGLLANTEYSVSYDAGNVYTGFNRFCRANADNVFPEFSVRLSDDAGTTPTAADEISNTGLLSGQTAWTTFSNTFTTGASQTDAVMTVVMTGTGGVIGADVIFDNFMFSANSADTETYVVIAEPVANNDLVEDQTPGAAVEDIDILGNDTVGDTALDTSTVVFTTTGVSGATLATDGKTLTVLDEGEWTVNSDGTVTFTPEIGYTGDPTPVSYTVDDEDGDTSNEATVTVTYTDPEPAIELVQTVTGVEDTNGDGIFGNAGDTILYEYTAENTGDTGLADLVIDDNGLGDLTAAGVTFDDTGIENITLDVGEGPVVVATAEYIIQPGDSGDLETQPTITSTAVAVDDAGDIVLDGGETVPLFDEDGDELDAVTDVSDTGSEPVIPQGGTDGSTAVPTQVSAPATTDTDGTSGNDADETTVVTLPDLETELSTTQ